MSLETNSSIQYTTFQTDLGTMLIAKDGKGLVRLTLLEKLPKEEHSKYLTTTQTPQSVFEKEIKAIQLFLKGDKKALNNCPWKLGQVGTEFQKSVWNAMKKIPAGTTLTYGELAQQIGRPKSARAVGNACRANPILLLTPCHRVVAQSQLGGYGELGLSTKQLFLRIEGYSKYK
jgi:methylated-DNA-[protein]-cysteine S-methyltransferase